MRNYNYLPNDIDLCAELREIANRLAREGMQQHKRVFRALADALEASARANSDAKNLEGGFFGRDFDKLVEGINRFCELRDEASALDNIDYFKKRAREEPFK